MREVDDHAYQVVEDEICKELKSKSVFVSSSPSPPISENSAESTSYESNTSSRLHLDIGTSEPSDTGSTCCNTDESKRKSTVLNGLCLPPFLFLAEEYEFFLSSSKYSTGPIIFCSNTMNESISL